MIHEASEKFEEECIADAFKNYSAYHFLFALIAALLMQTLDQEMAATAERWMQVGRHSHEQDHHVVIEDTPEAHPLLGGGGEEQDGTMDDSATGQSVTPRRAGSSRSSSDAHDHHEGHGHQHLFVMPPADMGHIRRVISAVCMEFGVTLHSVFVGITVGLTTNTELKPLLVALFFHQLFEGMALGSRLVDASFGGKLEYILALVFSVSAPFGMIVSTIAVSISKSAMSGTRFVTTMAILDALCGGILLYLAFTLLLNDFVDDMKTYGARGAGHLKRKLILYAALWIGMLLMAFVGKWM
ncbi:solute carrier family 39 (zinc transporter), member 1/2/3 [Strigomonas culicis]|uniref:Solute carrier family 39 (Zinc transporter), member 1/2/3 n=1 Tax=Strigomonas culicis TaxID=28005 RepID=S9UJL3_9TRYP|nr:solute carrier family 39 (zinc transporter), member 1/2/3 [Strigomonas culicis]|eukprot:EPY29088.1 solute carrier family 39 (zinc transporter), member 1/2/3 [Strigomonas culicis]